MVNPNLKYNSIHLTQEIEWLRELLRSRLQSYLEVTSEITSEPPPPCLEGFSVYSQYIRHYGLTTEERVVLLLALIPFISPCLVEKVLREFDLASRDIPEIGGVTGSHHNGMQPTGETALFLIAGNDLERRLEVVQIFSPLHKFAKANLLQLEVLESYEPEASGRIILSRDCLSALTSGTVYHPPFNASFPAKIIETQYQRQQLVLHPETEKGLDDISHWLAHRQRLLNEFGFAKKINAGYKCLFHGPPGTGKSLTAALLGNDHGLPVYRIDLSMVISKYIGETEKNLASIFDAASQKQWILFFDEADALLGKRSVMQSGQDRYANQEVSYLLTRMEDYTGLAILATNFKQNIDKAFLRRFQSLVHFPAPGADERLKLWSQSFSPAIPPDESVRLPEIAKNYALTGSNIMNVARYASIMTLKNGSQTVSQLHIMEGIRRELAKEQTLADVA